MKFTLFSNALMAVALCGTSLKAQQDPLAQEKTDRQAQEIFKALRAVGFEAKDVVFPLYSQRVKLGYGVSVGEDKVLAKASELVVNSAVYLVDKKEQALRATIEGVYPQHDLAILKVSGLRAKAARWADATSLPEGAFLAAIRPDGEAQAMGVLSVQERSLKVEDQGFLGISMDPRSFGQGVRVESVVEGSAADEAGIKAGDLITEIEAQKVKGFFEVSNRLRRFKKGEKPDIKLMRKGREISVRPVLQGREIPEQDSRRLEQMDRMSGTRSVVRSDFGNVLQSDMELEASDSGLPVVDLEGRIVGLVIARQGRISTLILPGDDLAKILESEPEEVTDQGRQVRRSRSAFGGQPRRRDSMQRELEEMMRMMQRLQSELNRE